MTNEYISYDSVKLTTVPRPSRLSLLALRAHSWAWHSRGGQRRRRFFFCQKEEVKLIWVRFFAGRVARRDVVTPCLLPPHPAAVRRAVSDAKLSKYTLPVFACSTASCTEDAFPPPPSLTDLQVALTHPVIHIEHFKKLFFFFTPLQWITCKRKVKAAFEKGLLCERNTLSWLLFRSSPAGFGRKPAVFLTVADYL